MQISVLQYFEKGALAKSQGKVAFIDGGCRYTFGEIERFAKNCAPRILSRTAAINEPLAVFLPRRAHEIMPGYQFHLGHHTSYQGEGKLFATL